MAGNNNGVIVRFEKASFNFGHNHPILEETDFTIRRGAKITIMGQNGAGKSTIFKLIENARTPEDEEDTTFKLEEGEIHIQQGLTIATAKQVIPRPDLELTVTAFFEKALSNVTSEKIYDIDRRIDKVLEIVNLPLAKPRDLRHAPSDRIIKTFSGGQQARLLLASAIIQDPDMLLLDEPTNNLDKAGIAHLTEFIKNYKKTVVVISHDAEFLNSFTEGVLYLDIFNKKVEQYTGNYFDLLKEITARIERENKKNALLAKEIQEKKDKANMFANKGGQMRLVAKRMKEKAEELEEEIVDVRREDKTIRNFVIPCQPEFVGDILTITSFTTMNPTTHKPVSRKATIALKKRQHLLLKGPNGIGKSTLLEALASGHAKGATIADGVRVGYYRQDFSTLNFEHTVEESLREASETASEEHLRTIAGGFLLTGDLVKKKVGMLSEGQKGLVAFARLVLQKPGLLILDEPTNHINFRHIPVIAKALDSYEGAMILVSHVPEFVEQIRIDEMLDLEK
ncbi:MAG: ATP-binding cassette domain-containing protein [Candidatus Paceibacterota bacterium]|jgi:ATPase subunit of ABC transporter with duplicated ATPase domains